MLTWVCGCGNAHACIYVYYIHTSFPSGRKATASTSEVWECVSMSSFLKTFHILTVPSHDPEARMGCGGEGMRCM